jgi:RNA polymerase sigma-70 factor (ECF subfamily)
MSFEAQMLAIVPELRAFARVLVQPRAEADDIVQDTLLRMWAARDRFEPGTNMRAWAFTILRRHFYNVSAKRRETVCVDDVAEDRLGTPAMQERFAEGRDIRRALAALEPDLREVIALSVGSRMDYATIAGIVGVPVGTVKSRVFRARRRLAALLDGGARPASGSAAGRLRRVLTDAREIPVAASSDRRL